MDTKRFTIYFTSDLHGYIYPTDYRSRQERNIGLFKCASQFHKDGNTLVIDGGDILQGSPLGAYCHDTLGDASRFAEIMNRCGYDYVTLGNHDFNYGMDYLDSYLNALHARCVCENVRWDGARVRFPARIHTLENGLRIGIVGIVTDYVNIWEKPEHLSGITISDPIPAARAALESLRGRVDVTLCIYHGGFERDLATGRVLSTTHENVAYRLCQELDIPYVVKQTEIGDIIFNKRKEKNPCALCAKMRRGALNDMCREYGCNKLALGHHRDDAIETLLMSLFYEGRFHTFHPKTYLSRTGITAIRPLCYLPEYHVRHMVQELNLPVVKSPCPANGETKRQEMKELMQALRKRYPDAPDRFLHALQSDKQYDLWQKE